MTHHCSKISFDTPEHWMAQNIAQRLFTRDFFVTSLYSFKCMSFVWGLHRIMFFQQMGTRKRQKNKKRRASQLKIQTSFCLKDQNSFIGIELPSYVFIFVDLSVPRFSYGRIDII
jgi:hypothetical protein